MDFGLDDSFTNIYVVFALMKMKNKQMIYALIF